MSDHTDNSKSDTGRLGRKATLAVCSLILLLAAGVTGLIFSTEPTASREGAVRESAMLVETSQVRRGTFNPTIVAVGTVIPAQDISLSPRVGGMIVERSPAFTPGGFVEKGRMLLRIDPSDYEIALNQRRSELQQAQADLELEMGRQTVAKKDYQFLDRSLDDENKALVLRQPQLNAARARVQAALAAVRQARLALERTSVTAPFDAHILTRHATVGSQVAAGDNLGRLVGLDEYWVQTTIPQSHVRWLAFPDAAGREGSIVKIRNRSAWPEGRYRTGRLHQLVGTLEGRTRMARVLVTVEDPLAHRSPSSDLPPLMIGAFVEARIRARPIADVIRLNRDYVRKNNTVWIMADGRLAIRDVDIVFQDAEYAYIRNGIEDMERVVTTNLSTVVDGAKLREKSPPDDSLTNSNPDRRPLAGGTG